MYPTCLVPFIIEDGTYFDLRGLTNLRIEAKFFEGELIDYVRQAFCGLHSLQRLALWSILDKAEHGCLHAVLSSVRNHSKQLTELECGQLFFGGFDAWCGEVVGGMTQLKRLNLTHCQIQDCSLRSMLGQLSSLESLTILREELVTCESLLAVGQISSLTSLTLAELPGVEAVDLSCLSCLTQLQQLMVYDVAEDADAEDLRAAIKAEQQCKLGKVVLQPFIHGG